MYKKFGGVRYTRNDTLLSDNQVAMVLYKENSAAYVEFKKAKKVRAVASVMSFAGGILMAFPLGTAVLGGEPEWELAAGGAALIVAAIPVNRRYKARSLQALDMYNEKFAGKPRARIYFTGNGMTLKF